MNPTLRRNLVSALQSINHLGLTITSRKSERIKFLWFYGKNWGDALNPTLIQLLSKKVVYGYDINLFQKNPSTALSENEDIYLVVGSVLEHANKNTIVWGAGFTSASKKLFQVPKKILAVRGPLTHLRLKELGIPCQPEYGDPALLFPRFYNPKKKKKYALGLIPHYSDLKDERVTRLTGTSIEIKLIDIRSGIYNFIDQLLECEVIASSSLHGLIMADAYQIPSIWLSIRNKIDGGQFKFHDYYESIELKDQLPFCLDYKSSLSDLVKKSTLKKISVDLDSLLNVCPFLNRCDSNPESVTSQSR